MKENEAIAKRLIMLMNEKNVSVFEITQRSKLSLSAVNEILSAKNRTARFNSVFQFAKALNVELEEIFNDDLFLLENLDK